MVMANLILPVALWTGRVFRLIWLKQLDNSNCQPVKAMLMANLILPGALRMGKAFRLIWVKPLDRRGCSTEVWHEPAVHPSGKLNRPFCSKHVADDYSPNDLFPCSLPVEKNDFLSSKSHT
jgi:hypothetical protein